MTDIVDIYMECGNFHEAVKKSGLPIHVAYLKLLKSGCLKIQDKINFGSAAAKMGGRAEEEFQRLVPDAIDANRYFQKNNPVYDFYMDGITIDVKYSSRRTNKGIKNGWGISVRGDQDFIVAFLEHETGKELENYYVLCIPMAFVDQTRKLSITEGNVYFKEFMVEPEELQPMLKEYADLRKEGLF